MKAYFVNITNEERSNILDKHKTLYDGYSVRNETPNEQPLYVQDLANDKEGITVKSNGEVSKYNNKIYMKESSGECDECGYMEEDTDEGIYDIQDLSGKFDYVEEKELDEINPKKLKKGKKYKYTSPSFDDEIEYDDTSYDEEDTKMYNFKGKKSTHSLGKNQVEKFVDDIEEEYFVPKSKMIESEYLLDESLKPEFKDKLQESLDMFKRFKKYN